MPFEDEQIFERMLDDGDSESVEVYGSPCYCLKTRLETNEKLFVNVCSSPEVPEPPSATDSGDEIRFSASFGERHLENDVKSVPCAVYDVIFNDKFLAKVLKDPERQNVLNRSILMGLAQKYELDFGEIKWSVLKNKKKIGQIRAQHVLRGPRIAAMFLETRDKQMIQCLAHKIHKTFRPRPNEALFEFVLDRSSLEFDDLKLWVGEKRKSLKLQFKQNGRVVYETQANLKVILSSFKEVRVDCQNSRVFVECEIKWS